MICWRESFNENHNEYDLGYIAADGDFPEYWLDSVSSELIKVGGDRASVEGTLGGVKGELV